MKFFAGNKNMKLGQVSPQTEFTTAEGLGRMVGELSIFRNSCNFRYYIFFYRQLDFSSEPGVANEILENEPKSCLKVA